MEAWIVENDEVTPIKCEQVGEFECEAVYRYRALRIGESFRMAWRYFTLHSAGDYSGAFRTEREAWEWLKRRKSFMRFMAECEEMRILQAQPETDDEAPAPEGEGSVESED